MLVLATGHRICTFAADYKRAQLPWKETDQLNKLYETEAARRDLTLVDLGKHTENMKQQHGEQAVCIGTDGYHVTQWMLTQRLDMLARAVCN
jgi:hypothetical protein